MCIIHTYAPTCTHTHTPTHTQGINPQWDGRHCVQGVQAAWRSIVGGYDLQLNPVCEREKNTHNQYIYSSPLPTHTVNTQYTKNTQNTQHPKNKPQQHTKTHPQNTPTTHQNTPEKHPKTHLITPPPLSGSKHCVAAATCPSIPPQPIHSGRHCEIRGCHPGTEGCPMDTRC